MLKKLFTLSLAQQQSLDIEMWQGWDAWVSVDFSDYESLSH
ncbi:hypothetical protein [Marinomonas sp. THO17]